MCVCIITYNLKASGEDDFELREALSRSMRDSEMQASPYYFTASLLLFYYYSFTIAL